MQSKKRILGVSGGRINFANDDEGSSVISRAQPRQMVTANAGFAGGTASNSLSVNGFWQSNYQYYMTGIIPADPHLIDTSTLALFYRDMYLFDNTGGSAVDILSHFGFSDFELRGLEEKELHPFQEACDRLSIQQMLPTVSVAHLTDGFFCGSLIFDPKSKQFMDTLIHDALSTAVIPSPFWNVDPTINVRVGQSTQQFMHDTSEYARMYMDSMPRQFIEMLKSGAFTVDPVTTLFVPRRSTTDRAYTSYLHRLLPMYLIEKVLFRGTLVEAQRRQRAMTHITAGDDVWTPTGEELHALVSQFQQAEFDPLGGWVSTRNAVQAVDLRPGGDFWKWTDMADVLVPYKLRALGISESFMSGESSYAAAESAYSTFLETINAYREQMTHRVFYQKLFPLVAVVNNMYKDPAKGAKNNRIIEFLFNNANRANLKMPQIHWHKDLEAKGEENMMELLEMASDKGVPIPLKMWMAAAKIDPEGLVRDLEEDRQLRARLEQYTGKDTSHEGEEQMNPDMHGDQRDQEREIDGPGDKEFAALFNRTTSELPSTSFKSGMGGYRKPILSRDFGDSGDTWTLTKTGRIKHNPNPVAARIKHNNMIYKISKEADKDPNYREKLKKANAEKLGTATLKGF
jgi:hypothetical protein